MYDFIYQGSEGGYATISLKTVDGICRPAKLVETLRWSMESWISNDPQYSRETVCTI